MGITKGYIIFREWCHRLEKRGRKKHVIEVTKNVRIYIYCCTICLLSLHINILFVKLSIMSYRNNSTNVATSSSGSANVHTAQAENVRVQSVVQTETQSKVSLENEKKI